MELEFVEVNETERTYLFPDGGVVTIENPKRLHVRPTGTHRLEDADGNKWIIPVGWVAIKFKAANWSI